jgi:hypothetical protein
VRHLRQVVKHVNETGYGIADFYQDKLTSYASLHEHAEPDLLLRSRTAFRVAPELAMVLGLRDVSSIGESLNAFIRLFG